LVGFLYNVLLLIAAPGVFVYYLWRISVSRKSNKSWRQNLGGLPYLSDRESGRKLIWVHAASVGEVIACTQLLDALRALLPDSLILVTTITQTGNDVARKSAKAADVVAYFPIDYLPCVYRALRRIRPDAFVMVETEIWPNFLAALKRMGVPRVLVNGRISDRSFARGRKWRWLYSWAAANIDHCCMQSQTDADRIEILGARPESVQVFGNTKFDQDGVQVGPADVRRLRADLGLPPEGASVFVAGSTNVGEDEPVLDAFGILRGDVPSLRLIIAPRQIDRADEIEEMVRSRRFRCIRRSVGKPGDSDFDVLILDTFGELASVYAVGQIAFVGGSLIPKGGHSIFQPIMQGKPVMFGPHMHNFRDIAQLAVAEGIGFQVADATSLAERAKALLSDVRRLAEIDAACRKMISDNQGASRRCADLIASLV